MDNLRNIRTVEKALDFLNRAAETVGVDNSNCRSQINTALEALYLAKTYLVDENGDLMGQLESAKKALSSCNNTIATWKTVDLGRVVLHLAKRALENVEAVMESLNMFVSHSASYPDVEPNWTVNWKGIQTYSASIDYVAYGTKCQFTRSGSGRALPSCAFGFAAGVTGGANGQSYVVTSSDDNPTSPQPGTLRYGLNLARKDNKGIWITFERDMLIVLYDKLWIMNSTTIDGRGVNVTITKQPVVLCGVTNVILHNFQVNSIDNSDTVHIFDGSTKVWVDHITSFDADKGLVSVVQGSTDVTISNCRLSNLNFNMLLGASDYDFEDKNMRITVYRNWFRDSFQRMPHCRLGYCHVSNNLYTNWGFYAIGARVHATILSEQNLFIAGERKEATPWFPGAAEVSGFDDTSIIQSVQDEFRNGTTFHQFLQFGTGDGLPYLSDRSYPRIHPTRTLDDLLQRCAGAQFGFNLRTCLSGTD
ncbi:hypothetical protein O6H91_19G002000 [Diphasiastrum complanatum]|nr:hypothetical protein O6H91_19G002000 [Diphasiastrum complanatum]